MQELSREVEISAGCSAGWERGRRLGVIKLELARRFYGIGQ